MKKSILLAISGLILAGVTSTLSASVLDTNRSITSTMWVVKN